MKVCPKCGTQVTYFGWMDGKEYYYCPRCEDVVLKFSVKEVRKDE